MPEPDDSLNNDDQTVDLPDRTPSADSTRASPTRRATNNVTPEVAQSIVGERYRIMGSPVSGGMGSVFAAIDERLERKVAIKIMRTDATHAESAGTPIDRGRMLAEARAIAGLAHPHICRVHEVIVDGPSPFIVMEWIDGIDLKRAWSKGDLKWRLSIFVKVVQAVAAAHELGLIHRDLKPDNILVDRRNEPVIVDFGLARILKRESDAMTTGGTPGYAAPEQFLDESAISAASDVYALGVLLFELLTNRPPFTGGSVHELLKQMREEDAPVPEEYAPDAPWPLQRICLTALERDADKRYPSAQAMLDDVQRYLRGESVAARPSILTDRFYEQVEQQLDHVESWRKQGLVTATESDKLERVLTSVLRPESYWIVDSRSLSGAQVTLYLGGWLVLIALAIGTGFAWQGLDHLPGFFRILPAWVATAALLWVGMALQRGGHRRVFLGYLITACLAAPVALWLLFFEFGWLEGVGVHGGTGELLEVAGLPSVEGLSNAQLLVESGVWMVLAILLRISARSSAFTPIVVVAGLLIWLTIWASAGMIRGGDHDRWYLAGLGLWVILLGTVLLGPGLALNRREEVLAKEHGRYRMRTRDAWALLTMSVFTIIGGLAIVALTAPEIQTLNLLSEYVDWIDMVRVTPASLAFMVNGVLLYGLIMLFEHRRTVVRRRLAELLRWVMPSHILAAALILEIHLDEETSHAVRLIWVLFLTIGAIAMCYWSVHRQWRPFLFAGLFYIAAAYFRVFMWVGRQFEDDQPSQDRWFIILAITVLLIGAATMFISWKAPAWLATTRLSRWASRGGAAERSAR